MNKKQKRDFILHTLSQLFPDPPIPLVHKDPYTLLIAVLLSAQCTDKKVNEITPLLFTKASTPEKMITLSVEEIQSIIKSCGLSNNKAKAIHELSHILLNEHNGEVPQDIYALERLPGVGHKTASVVMIQAFDQDAFPVDTHIHRLAKRWGLSDGSSVKNTEKDLKAFFPQKYWKKLHLQMIYFARAYCSAKNHHVDQCPICSKL